MTNIIPKPVQTKIYKTGQTRGADDDVIYQNPGGFAGINSELFIPAATNNEKRLAKRVLDGEYYYPATNALWFYAPVDDNDCASYWYDQKLSGRYKNHCFYEPYPGVCEELH